MYRLAPGGRLVAIVGGGINPAGRELGGLATDSRGYRSFWNNAKKEASLRANIHVDGKVYQRFGTAYDTRVIVFDKPIEGDPNSEGALEGSVQTVEELVEMMEGIRNERQTTGQTRDIDTIQQRKSPTQSGGTGTATDLRGRTTEPFTRAGADTGGDRPTTPEDAGLRPGSGRGETTETVGGEPEASDAVSDPLQGGQRADEGSGAGEGSGESTGRITDTDRDNVGQPDGRRRGDSTGPTVGVEKRAEEVKQASKENLTFATYSPTAETLPANAQPHVTPLDETVAMAEIPLPDASYVPDLPAEIIESGALSDAQLEFITYAGQAHETTIIGADGRQYRGGIFNGDGTGVGKGRQVAGVILDNYRKGRKKALWLTKDPNLFSDAQRDLKGLGMNPDMIRRINKFKVNDTIKMDNDEGILFVTYGTLWRKNDQNTRSRIDQIVEWVGSDRYLRIPTTHGGRWSIAQQVFWHRLNLAIVPVAAEIEPHNDEST